MKRLLLSLAVFAMAALAIPLAVSAQTPSPTPQEGQDQQVHWAMATLLPSADTTFQGFVVLHEAEGRTDIVGLVAPIPSFFMGGEQESQSSPSDVQAIAIHEGTCTQPGQQVLSMSGSVRQRAGVSGFVANGQTNMPLSELVDGDHIAVAMGQSGDGMQGTSTLACAPLTQDAMLTGPIDGMNMSSASP